MKFLRHTSKYLYGVRARDFKDMKYKEALKYKLNSAKFLVKHLMVQDTVTDRQRLHYVLKAMKHTERLIMEIENDE
ncbi:MAG: hypothetical protein IE909_11910 [Campylobacterales bacterium]|nr:hypothetical protein [Campylobacterales bacterium]